MHLKKCPSESLTHFPTSRVISPEKRSAWPCRRDRTTASRTLSYQIEAPPYNPDVNDTPQSQEESAPEGQPPKDVAYPKTIKSFVRRAGRTTDKKAGR